MYVCRKTGEYQSKLMPFNLKYYLCIFDKKKYRIHSIILFVHNNHSREINATIKNASFLTHKGHKIFVHFTEIDKTFQKDVRQLILSISTQFRTKKDILYSENSLPRV